METIWHIWVTFRQPSIAYVIYSRLQGLNCVISWYFTIFVYFPKKVHYIIYFNSHIQACLLANESNMMKFIIVYVTSFSSRYIKSFLWNKLCTFMVHRYIDWGQGCILVNSEFFFHIFQWNAMSAVRLRIISEFIVINHSNTIYFQYEPT